MRKQQRSERGGRREAAGAAAGGGLGFLCRVCVCAWNFWLSRMATTVEEICIWAIRLSAGSESSRSCDAGWRGAQPGDFRQLQGWVPGLLPRMPAGAAPSRACGSRYGMSARSRKMLSNRILIFVRAAWRSGSLSELPAQTKAHSLREWGGSG